MIKITTFLTTVGLMFCAITMSAQLTFSLSPTNVTANSGDTVTIDVIAEGFTDIGSCQFSINWDPAILTYETVTDITLPGLSLTNNTLRLIDPGRFIVGWTDPSAMETTVPTGSIFKMKFVAQAGGNTNVEFTNNPSAIEVFGLVNGSLDLIIPDTDNPSSVTVMGSPPITTDTLILTVDDVNVTTGGSTCVDVTADNFDSIATLQYTMEWDPNILQFDSVTNFGLLGLGSGNFGLPSASMGLLPMTWNDSTTQSFQTLPNGTVLYQICFSALGDGGSSSSVVINDSLASIEVTTPASMGNDVGAIINPGSVSVTGSGSSVFVYAVNDTVETADTVCIPISVKNFDMLSGLQFSINWDTAVMTYHAIENFVLPGGIANSFILNFTDDGKLALGWSDPAGTGVTLADSTTIFDVCFIVKGSTGESSDVSFTDDPRADEAVQEDGMGGSTILPVVTQNGGVAVTGLPTSGFAIAMSNESGEVGDTVCIDLTVQDFFNMEAAQWVIGYNTSVLNYVGPQNITLAGLNGVIIELNEGLIRVLWATPTGLPVTVPNNSAPIFQACFEILSGNVNDNYPIFFTNDPGIPPLSEEFARENGDVITDYTLVDGSITISSASNPCNLSQTNIVNDISCNGANDGSISLTVTGAATMPTFSWSSVGGYSSMDEDITGLSADTYSVTITDPGTPSCELIINDLVVNNPTAVTASAVGSTVTCVGATDGTITVTASGGTGALMYSLDGTNFQASNIFNGQAAGNYTVTVQDANNCPTTTAVTVSAPTPITVTLAATQASCNGGMDAMITVTASGGTGTLTYSINGNPAQASNIFTGLGAGGYAITVFDASNCTGTAMTTVSELSAITASASTTGVTCFGDSDGTITVTASGGAGTFMYSLDGGTPQASNVFNGVSGGSHTIAVSDGSGCDATISADVSEPAEIIASASAPAINCNGELVTITVTASGGTGVLSYSLDGTSFQGGNTFPNQSGGNYTVTVRDASNCSTTTMVNVVEPTVITASATTTDVTCNGDTDGTITVSASGGTGVLQYSLNGTDFQASNTFNGQAAGNYTITVRDANNCDITTTATINGPSLIVITASTTQASCNGATDGTITVTAAGGEGTYTYSIGGAFQASNVFNGVASGMYTITVRDGDNCENTNTTEVTEASGISASATTTDASCNGATDGSITVTATGGSGNYEYSLDGGTAQASNVFNGVASGAHTILITDLTSSCTSSLPVTVDAGAGISASTATTDASCNGATDGSITVTVTGGSGNYEYSLDSGTAQASNVFNGVASGSHDISVTDLTTGCTDDISVTVDAGAGISASATTSDESCPGAADGIIIVNVTDGSGNYEYTLDGGTAQSSNTFGSVASGSHDISVTDLTTGCTDDISVTLNAATGITATTTVDDVSCNGFSDGEVTVNASGGTGNLEYSIDNGANYQASTDFGGLAAGMVSIIIRDENNCTITVDATVNEPPALTATATATDVSCNGGSDGTVTITASGGTGNLEYSNGGAFVSDNVFTGLSQGTITYTVRDENGCTTTVDATVNEPAPLSITADITPDVTGVEGAIDITVLPAGTYTYNWLSTNGSGLDPNAEDQTGLSSGDYSVTATSNGCTISETFTVPNESTPGITNVDIDNVSCNGGSNGRIIIEVLGGTAPYEYSWSCSNSTTNVAAGLSAGTCDVTVTDFNDVEVTGSYTITEPTAIVVDVATSPVSCSGNNNGSITLTVSGGTPGTAPAYTFDWDTAPDVQNPTGLAPGNYNVTVTDANGCTQTAAATVGNPQTISLSSINPTNVLCQGDNTGSIDIEVAGGTAPYGYSWENVSVPGTELSDNQDINGLFAGSYIVIVTDFNGCSFTSNPINISEPSPITATESITNVSCNGGNNGSITLDISGGVGAYNVAWNTGNGTGLTAGIYFATISDANNCELTVGPMMVTQPSAIAINESITPVITGGDGSIQLSISGGTPDMNGDYFYNWSPVNSTSSEITSLDAGEYCVTVTDANGCTEEKCYDLSCPLSVDMSNTIINNVTCNGGSDASIDVSVICGDGNYTYAWSGPNFNSASEDVNGLTAGTYTLDISDGNGSTFSRTFTITEPSPITISNVIITPESGAGCNGGINITVNGGMPPYTYQWSNGAEIEDPTDLCKGSYGVNIIDSQGCFASVDGYVVGAGPLVIASSDVDPVTCTDNTDGQICIQVFGGCEPYTFSLPDGTTQSALNPNDEVCFEDLAAGSYMVTITELGGQQMTQNYVVGEASPIAINIDGVINNTDATGTNCNGAINISVAGGQGPYTYQWSNGDSSEDISGLCEFLSPYSLTVIDANGCLQSIGNIEVELGMSLTTDVTAVSCTGATDGQISVMVTGGQAPLNYAWEDGSFDVPRVGLGAGVYSLTVTDATGATVESGNVIVGEPSPIVITFTATNPTASIASGSITTAVNGGTPGYTYNWSTGDNTPSVGGLSAGVYSVTVFDSRGCQSTGQVTLTNDPDDIAISVDEESCVDDCDATVTATASFGTAPYTYIWNDDLSQTTPTAFNLCAGSYTVAITDATGTTMTMNATVNGATPMSATVETTKSTGLDGTINVNVTGGAAPYSYQWNTPDGDVTAEVRGLAPGTYFVIVTDANGCRLEPAPSGVVGVESDCFQARDIITPTSSDNRNDVFIIACALDFDNTLEIYNRWGQLVYETTNYDNTWNGVTVDGNELPEGAYFWVIKYRDDNGDPQQVKGHLTILR